MRSKIVSAAVASGLLVTAGVVSSIIYSPETAIAKRTARARIVTARLPASSGSSKMFATTWWAMTA